MRDIFKHLHDYVLFFEHKISPFQLGFIIAFLLAWYYLYWKTYDIYVDVTDLGYSEAERKCPGNNMAKRNIINELKKAKKKGNLPPVYPNGWFVVLESRDLKSAQVQEISCLGMPLVAWRGKTGKSYVADAYCPHLGAHLGINGKVSGDCLSCPFHGWTFEGETGDCVYIPYDNSIPRNSKIKIHTTVEQNGFIYLWHHAEKIEPTWYPKKFKEVTSGRWCYNGRSEFHTSCVSQEIMENLSDVHHFSMVHGPDLIWGAEFYNRKFNLTQNELLGKWRTDPKDKEHYHEANLDVTSKIFLLGLKIFDTKFTMNQEGPGIINVPLNVYGVHGIFFIVITPISPRECRILHQFYTGSKLFRPIGTLFLFAEAIQVSRDIAIFNRKTYLQKPLLSKEDKYIKEFRRWYNQFYSPSSPNFSRDARVESEEKTTKSPKDCQLKA